MSNWTWDRWALPLAWLPLLLSCGRDGGIQQRGYVAVVITSVNGAAPPSAAAPLPPNLGDIEENWVFEATVMDGLGGVDSTFNGYARVSVVPGAVNRVEGKAVIGRNVLFIDGKAEGIAVVSAVFGPSRLWIADIGYEPAPVGVIPICSNGFDDDKDILNDFPNDPGCAFANDMSEEPGTNLTGVSAEILYALPTVADVQGRGTQTPFPSVAVEIKPDDPNYLVVTRVSSDGFFLTDIGDTAYNHMYAFNFNTPAGMRVCDRLLYLTGTATEFFGFTEITFPSYEVEPVLEGEPCLVPEPQVLLTTTIQSNAEMERLESGLVALDGFRITGKFGSGLAVNNNFSADASNCDLNQDGEIDFFNDAENSCSNACAADADCTEWVGFASRGNYKVSKQGVMVQINTAAVDGFNPLAYKGQTLARVAGILRNFSGGSLNWTVETRCGDDLVCNFDPACQQEPVSSTEACVTLRTVGDNESGTN